MKRNPENSDRKWLLMVHHVEIINAQWVPELRGWKLSDFWAWKHFLKICAPGAWSWSVGNWYDPINLNWEHMSYWSRAYYTVFAWWCHFCTFFVTFFISPIHGHKSENNWLSPYPLYQNCMKNSNLKLNVRYEVHDKVKFNIFEDFFSTFFTFSHTSNNFSPCS